MASVERVYRAVKDIANKDQRGFITPAIFNEFAGIAQMNVFNRLFDEMGLSVRMRRSGADAQRQFAKAKKIEEDLSTFSKKATLNLVAGVADKPSDFARVIAITTPGKYVLGNYQQYQVQIVYNTEHMDRILTSDLSAANSVDFEMPEQYFTELVTEILTLVGVNLRDSDVYNYGASETTKDEAQ